MILAPDRRGAVARAGVIAGLVIATWAQWSAPLRDPPVYDGVAVVDPYRYLAPAPGQPGKPGSATATLAVSGGHGPLVAVSTPESPPQAQIFAPNDAFVLPAGSTQIRVSIRPVLPPGQPASGHIAGNVYRISVTNQAGTALRALASAQVSIILRAPEGTNEPIMERWTGTAWEPARSSPETQSMYLAVVTGFGDFAMLAAGPAASVSGSVASAAASALASPVPSAALAPSGASGSTGSDTAIVIAVLVVALVVLVLWHRRSTRSGVEPR